MAKAMSTTSQHATRTAALPESAEEVALAIGKLLDAGEFGAAQRTAARAAERFVDHPWLQRANEVLNRGREVSRTIWVTAHDLLVATNRGTGGVSYERLQAGLDRLSSTFIKTNIVTNGKRVIRGFGLIDSYEIVERSPVDKRMVAVEITLSEWLYNAIVGREVLTISRDYFRLRKGLERRLYELARKHCGRQTRWKVGLDILHKKSGSSSTLREFRRKVSGIAKTDHMPDYRLAYQADMDQVSFYARSPEGALKEVREAVNDHPQGHLF